VVFHDDGQLQRTVGKADSGTANVGEGVAIAEQIAPGDRDIGGLTCPKTFRLLTKAEGAEGYREGIPPAVFWTAALDRLDELLS